MCGRYSIAVEPTEVEERFRAAFAETAEPMKPRYNAAPSQKLPVILNADPPSIIFSRWGVKPAWLARVTKKSGLINVRFETLRDKHTFRSDLEKRRCLVPADGYYEWKALPGGKKVPFRITRQDGKLFAFAGIWQESPEKPEKEAEEDEGNPAPHFAIITTAANELMLPIHSRMPVILDEERERAWLSGEGTPRDFIALLGAPPTLALHAYEVSKAVNRASVDIPEIIKPVADVP